MLETGRTPKCEGPTDFCGYAGANLRASQFRVDEVAPFHVIIMCIPTSTDFIFTLAVVKSISNTVFEATSFPHCLSQRKEGRIIQGIASVEFLKVVRGMILKSFFSNPVTKRHVERKVLNTHPLHLFRIIQDVDKYDTFLPLCQYSKIIRRSPDGRSFDGKLKIGSPPLFSEEYVSRVTVIPEELIIETHSIESKRFDSLKSRWKLQEIDGGGDDGGFQCDVDFEVEMTVSDPVIVSILDRVLEQVATRQVTAFEKRCHELPMPYDLIEAAKNFRWQ